MSLVPRSTSSFFESDPEKNRLADKVIALIGEVDEIDDALARGAGRRALANRHFFTIQSYEGTNDGGFQMQVTSMKAWKAGDSEMGAGLVSLLTPDSCGEVAETTYEFDEDTTIKQAAAEMKKIGFRWDIDAQNGTDARVTQLIAQVYAGLPVQPLKEADKPAAPKKRTGGPGGFAGPGGCMRN